ncbi:MAG TPA: glycosyltransferase family 2 protein [Thermoanaerobaculia bacterium]|nr:glycosyltransferase family 2 protein [Thermoanaerobaculia bacterium]
MAPSGRIVVAIENESQRRWLPALDCAPAGLAPVFFYLAGLRPEPAESAREVGRSKERVALPDFAQIVAGLEAEQPVACLVAESGPLARLVSVAADLLGLPVFYLVTTAEELRNLSARAKQRSDLFFLASESLLPAALNDPRYGSTLLPTGHPDQKELGPRGGRPAERIVAAVSHWLAGTLPMVPPELAIIVPAYKEEGNLALVCDRLLAMLDQSGLNAEILLVDDASPDSTYEVALSQMWRSPRIRAFAKPLPRGMGNGIRYGLRHARAQIVVVTMGDGSDEVDRIPEMFAKVRDEGFSLAIGSRYRHRRNYQTVPQIYRFWSFCFRLAARLLIGLRLSDYTNAFRAFDRRIFDRYGPESGGFEISPEITFKAWFATRRVAEVDVRHLKRASGQSSFSFLRAGPGYGKMLFKALVKRITGRWFVLDW